MIVNDAATMLGAIIGIKFRVLNGEGMVIEDKSTYYRVIRESPPPGQVIINAFPFHPSEIAFAFDTIANNVLNAATVDATEIRVKPACYYREERSNPNLVKRTFVYSERRDALTVEGDDGFSLGQYSVSVVETGKRKHTGANIASGVLTLFSNVETQKKRSVLYTRDHSIWIGAVQYHCLISYSEVKTADRHREKDQDGVSLEVSDYNSFWQEISPDAIHYLVRDTDTISSFKIKFRRVEEDFHRMWDGVDTATIATLPVELRNLSTVEMEMAGTLESKPFMLTTSNRGRTKKFVIDGEHLLSFYQNNEPAGRIDYRKLTREQIQAATTLCLISDRYTQ